MTRTTANSKVYGIDCKRLGSLYASAVLQNTKTRIIDLPELQLHSKYKTLHDNQKTEVRNYIRSAAKYILTMAGYAPEVVARVLDGK